MKPRIVLVGGGGHAKSIIDAIRSKDEYHIVGILDNRLPIGENVAGVPITGQDCDANTYYNQGVEYAFISVGSIGNCGVRKKIEENLKRIGFKFPIIVDASAILADEIKIAEGCFIGKGVIINSDVEIGKQAIINTGAVIEHDSRIGDFVHLAPRSVICGNVSIMDETHIGANSTVIQGIQIGKKSLIGAGSVVTQSIKSYKVAYGNPCREVRINE